MYFKSDQLLVIWEVLCQKKVSGKSGRNLRPRGRKSRPHRHKSRPHGRKSRPHGHKSHPHGRNLRPQYFASTNLFWLRTYLGIYYIGSVLIAL